MSYRHLEDRTPKARKTYRCYLCGSEITPGTVHVKRAFVDDDGAGSVRMHAECVKLTEDWKEDDWEYFRSAEFKELMEKVGNVGR